MRFRVLGRIRNISLSRAVEHKCDFYFVADADNFIRPCTLRELLAVDLPIVSPLLRSIEAGQFYSNYHAEVDANGYYKNCDQYQWILNRWVRGVIEVPVVHTTYLIRADMIHAVNYEDATSRHEYVVFSDSARQAGAVQYLDNRQVYGYIAFGEDSEHYVVGGVERARSLLSGGQGVQGGLNPFAPTPPTGAGSVPGISQNVRPGKPRVFGCFGQHGSGSTWMFNLVREICLAEGVDFVSVHRDSKANLPWDAPGSPLIVAKSQNPMADLESYIVDSGEPAVITVRDPRDSVVSFMQRFPNSLATSFEEALKAIAWSAERLGALSRLRKLPVFRYEDKFIGSVETFDRIAAMLRVIPSATHRAEILAALEPEAVKKKIGRLEALGSIRGEAIWDRETHWHANHVGDGKVGKFRDNLSVAQENEILRQTREYCDHFGYGVTASSRSVPSADLGGTTPSDRQPANNPVAFVSSVEAHIQKKPNQIYPENDTLQDSDLHSHAGIEDHARDLTVSPKTLVFCTAFAQTPNIWETRYRRWLSAIQGSILHFDQIIMIDDGSPTLPVWEDIEILAAESETVSDKTVLLFHFSDNLGRWRGHNYPGWYRSYAFAAEYAKRHDFKKIIHVESDAFLIGASVPALFNGVEDEWIALWVPFDEMPETAIQVAAGTGLDSYHAVTRRPYSDFVQQVIENVLPFTRVIKSFAGGRYPTYLNFVPAWAEYIVQVTEDYPSRYLWWLPSRGQVSPPNHQVADHVTMEERWAKDLSEGSENEISRIYTRHGTVLYVDENTWELRHGAIARSPANVRLVHDSSYGEIKFVSGDMSRSVNFTAKSSRVRDHESGDLPRTPTFFFELVDIGDGRVGLKSGLLWLSAEIGGAILLNRAKRMDSGTFSLSPDPSKTPVRDFPERLELGASEFGDGGTSNQICHSPNTSNDTNRRRGDMWDEIRPVIKHDDTGGLHTGVEYLEFLKLYATQMKPASYLEIGSEAGASLRQFECDAICIDPAFQIKQDALLTRKRTLFFQMTSDDFFARNDPTAFFPGGVDFGFLDGLHHFEALLCDFMNFERCSHTNSVAVLHDCLPTDLIMTSREFRWGGWTGDVWKILPVLAKYRPDLRIFLLDCPPTGLVICQNLNADSTILKDHYAEIMDEFSTLELDDAGLVRLRSSFPLVDTRRLLESGDDVLFQYRSSQVHDDHSTQTLFADGYQSSADMSIDNDETPSLYLDLLIKCVSGSIYRDPDMSPWGKRTYDPAMREVGADWPTLAHTMIGTKRLQNLRECVETVIKDAVPGDFIETGVWRGGACILMRGILKAYRIEDRSIYVADSFAGLPPASADYPADAGDRHHTHRELAVSLDDVQSAFQSYGLLDKNVIFVKGWFCDTLPALNVRQFAVIRLDGDMYESTIQAIEALYPRLSPGGFIIIDDYGAVQGCRQAVDDYRLRNEIVIPMRQIDWTGCFWRKPWQGSWSTGSGT